MPVTGTTAQFIERAKAVHGDRYDYTNVLYLNQITPVTLICRIHGAFKQKPRDHIHAGAGCPQCSGNTKLTLDTFLREAKAKHGDTYDYSEVVIVNNTTPVSITCPTHGVFKQTPKQHKKGRGCPQCAPNKKLTQAEVLERFKAAHGARYDYSRVKYTSAPAKVDIVCRTHGVFKQRASLHWEGRNCPKCAKRALGDHLFMGIEEAQARLAGVRDGYTYDLSSMSNNKSMVTVTCDKGHTFQQQYNDVRRYGCPTCAKRHSKGEQELLAFIQSLVPSAHRSRKIITPQELDVWCPEQKLGFEYNGLYYHSDAFDDAKWRHLNKSNAVSDAGGRLVHVWADDWTYRRNACEAMIRAHLGLLPRVHARDTTVVSLSTAEARAFLDRWHLQGHTPGVYYGLVHEGNLVAAMGFSRAKSVRGNKDAGLQELVRFCANARVVGGASKLLAHWKKSCANWHTLVTYCDHAQFSGGLYEALGFRLASRSGPDYKVILAGGDVRHHKSRVKKDNLKQLLGDKFDPGKSEAELCRENHIFRVWDCGKSKYILERY